MQYKSFRSAGNASWGKYGALYKYRRQLSWGAAGLGVFYVANLEQAPVSHRLRFMIVPRWLEMKVGDRAYRQTMRQFGGHLLPDSHPEAAKVRSVMKRIIKVADMPQNDLNWQIHVIRGQFPPNAFVLPGGKVFVFESILPICKDEDGLATILSHETAHQVCRHTAESMSRAPLQIAAALLLYAITGSNQIESLIMRLALELPASRQMETEADYVGVMMMAKACFEPAKALKLWDRMVSMEQRQGQSVPELLSTHPASEHRIQNIRNYLPEADSVWDSNCGHMQAFRSMW